MTHGSTVNTFLLDPLYNCLLYTSSVGEGINSEPEDREMICAMCQHAVQGIMYEWLSREKPDKKSLSDILMRANYLFGGGLERALERSANRSRN